MSKLGLDWKEGEKRESSSMVQYEEPSKPPMLVHEWPVGLSSEIALNDLSVGMDTVSEESLCKQFNLSKEELEGIKAHPAFRAEVRECLTQIKDSYATIKRKARIGFEFYLNDLVPKLMADEKVGGEVKLKTLMYLGKVMGLDAAEAASQAASESNKGVVSSPQINVYLTTPQSQQISGIVVDSSSVQVL